MDLDLDDFDGGILHSDLSQTSGASETLSTQDALSIINEWYTERNKRGRRMDLVGDYAGTEPFVLDGKSLLASMSIDSTTHQFLGESLIQNILDDPLLAIGRAEGMYFAASMVTRFYRSLLHRTIISTSSRQTRLGVLFRAISLSISSI
jgi:ATP-dependent RNA helicase DDX60